MSKKFNDLEDLVCYLEYARDTLLLIHNATESGVFSPRVLAGAVYSSYIQLDWITEEMQKQLEKLPTDIIRRAAGTT